MQLLMQVREVIKMACKDGVCSIAKAAPSQTRKKTCSHTKVAKIMLPRISLPVQTTKKSHNCSECHEHDHVKLPSLTKKIHEHSGHACTKQDCSIEAPHAHTIVSEPKPHVHGPHCNHVKEEQKSFKPLEEIINESKLPKWLKQLALNISFLTPALSINEVLETAKIPSSIKTLLALSGMHFTNRGTQKLGRLALTSAVALGARTGADFGYSKNLLRFIATSLVAVIEKFSGKGKDLSDELSVLVKNLKSAKLWKELLPSLFSVETKVQVLVPVVNKLISFITDGMESKKMTRSLLQIVLTSLSFVGFDKILQSMAGVFGKGSVFADMVTATCGCCGSPVCAAAATDSALQNTL